MKRLTGLIFALTAAGLAMSATLNNSAVRNWAAIAQWPQFQGGIWLQQRGPRPVTRDEPPAYLPAIAARLQAIGPIAPETLGNAFCEPLAGPFERTGQFFFSRDVILMMMDEDYLSVRFIYMDGRGHGDPDPSYYGHSVGHWEAGTLVIDTVGFLPEVTIAPKVEGNGATHSVERYRLLDANTLERVTTITNPTVLLKPWTSTVRYTIRRDLQVQEAECAQNNRDLPVNGATHIDLAEPR
jgi:hypothetical protein